MLFTDLFFCFNFCVCLLKRENIIYEVEIPFVSLPSHGFGMSYLGMCYTIW